MTDAPLVSDLRARTADAVRAALGSAATVALVGYPSHANPGDSAIWLGVLALLRASGCRVAYACDFLTYDRAALERAVGAAPILITGGGSFGDLYPDEQRLRERVLLDFPDNRVVQLPQSIHFRDPSALARARAAFAAHRRVVLMVRDRASAALATDALGVEPRLCPDCAFLLGPLERPGGPTRPVTVLRRRDVESGEPEGALDGIATLDWMDEPRGGLERVALRLRHHVRDRPDRHRAAARALALTHGPLARRRLRRGLGILSAGRVAVTDRLHGHILALLLGIPHVAVDTAQGKLSAFIDTWTASSPLLRRAGDFREACAVARAWDDASAAAADR